MRESRGSAMWFANAAEPSRNHLTSTDATGCEMPTVNFVNETKQIEVPQGANLRDEARKHGIQL